MATQTTYSDFGEMKFNGIGRFRLILIDHRGNYVFRRVDRLGECYDNGPLIFDYQGWIKIKGKRLYIAKERVSGHGMLIRTSGNSPETTG